MYIEYYERKGLYCKNMWKIINFDGAMANDNYFSSLIIRVQIVVIESNLKTKKNSFCLLSLFMYNSLT